jgi:hypothetical protein
MAEHGALLSNLENVVWLCLEAGITRTEVKETVDYAIESVEEDELPNG